MIRVIYRWQVEAAAVPEFCSWWHEGTLRIRSTYPGALGSTLLRSQDDPDALVGVARWESTKALLDFRQAAGTVIFEGASLVSMEIYDEVHDLILVDEREDGDR